MKNRIDLWKEFSCSYIKNNRSSCITIIVAAFVAALLLSFLSSLFYNFWIGEVHNIIAEEGDWQGRITAELTEEELVVIRNFGNTEYAAVNEELSGEEGIVVDITFRNPRKIYRDMPLLVQKLGLSENAAAYHTILLSRYLIHDPADQEPPLLISFYLTVLLMVSFSLILMIHNAFGVSMQARIHQFGIFSSIGATPGQIRMCLMQETAILCGMPVVLGYLIGILLSIGVISAMNRMAERITGAYASDYTYHPVVLAVTVSLIGLTVLFSAWLPARKLSRLTPLCAIRNIDEISLHKRKHSPVLSFLFGIEGELAGNALKAQRKALRTSALSLTLSFLGFTLILCFFTLSGISTRHTYFEKYQDAWDVMATIKDTCLADFDKAAECKNISMAQDVVIYQKAEAVASIPKKAVSRELTALGGFEAIAGEPVEEKRKITADAGMVEKTTVSESIDYQKVQASLVILDDESFLAYCKKNGVSQGLDGTIILNRIWDSVNSNFRYKKYIPFLEEGQEKIRLQSLQEDVAEIPVLGYTEEVPLLREEYEDYALVLFVPLSLWESIADPDRIGGAEEDTYVRILAEQRDDLAVLSDLEQDIKAVLGHEYETEVENRIQERMSNDEMILGYMSILGGLCVILALIGIANIFSNTMGFLRQRGREFARYLSVGMTPAGLRKMFCIEAMVIAGRPLLITLPLTVAAVGFMITASYLDPMEFIEEVPVMTILVFYMAILGFVALAYYLGAKKVLGYSLAEALRDETMI